MEQQTEKPQRDEQAEIVDARREFLAKCGRLAVVTPPAVTLMLAAARNNRAAAFSF